jgi:patatin-like phospholipase/acyl hydrolase
MPSESAASKTSPYRILSLDGGGAKGFYTLGILNEIEGIIQKPLSDSFDLIFGTSTGAIIAAMLALGYPVAEITELYKKHVPGIMRPLNSGRKTAALKSLATTIFQERDFSAFKTDVGIVTTNWTTEKPTIFKSSIKQAHGREGTFKPGFGCTIATAVVASCSAYPFFKRQSVTTSAGVMLDLADGGFCANNPALYALTDALGPLGILPENIRLVSLGVGTYPERIYPPYHWWTWTKKLPTVRFLQKTMEVNTRSMELLQQLLFKHVPTVRINESFNQPHMATDFLEHNVKKLDALYERGGESFGPHQDKLKSFLLSVVSNLRKRAVL